MRLMKLARLDIAEVGEFLRAGTSALRDYGGGTKVMAKGCFHSLYSDYQSAV